MRNYAEELDRARSLILMFTGLTVIALIYSAKWLFAKVQIVAKMLYVISNKIQRAARFGIVIWSFVDENNFQFSEQL